MEGNNNHKLNMKVTVYFVLLLISLSGCLHPRPRKTYTPRYGIEHNKVRDSLGIPLLDSSWVAIHMWDGVTVWGPKEKQPYPRHTLKQVSYFNDTLYCEYDIYTNGEEYQTIDGSESIYLAIWYFYRPARCGPWDMMTWNRDTVGWCYMFYDTPAGHSVNKAKADSILTSWGLKY